MLEVIEWVALAVILKSAALIPFWRRSHVVDIDHAWNTAWQIPEGASYVPELLLTNGSGLVSYVGSDGVLRTERAWTAESNDSPPIRRTPVGNVIPLFGRIGGE